MFASEGMKNKISPQGLKKKSIPHPWSKINRPQFFRHPLPVLNGRSLSNIMTLVNGAISSNHMAMSELCQCIIL